MVNQTPFTPAVTAFLALEAAVDEFTERGGGDVRRNTYRLRNLRVRQVLTQVGFHSFTNTGRESCSICTMKVPPFLRVDELYDRLKERGFIAYKCKGPLAADYMQIANMGELSELDLEGFLAAVTEIVEAARPVEQPPTRRPRLKSV
jgi:2-aminoethylphosphonate-pyruvate transaminase